MRNLDLTVCADPVVTHNTVSGDHAPALGPSPARSRAWLLPPAFARQARATAAPPPSNDCAPRRLTGFAIYQKTKDKTFFLNWISCGEAGLGLPTAVHESVHYITAETDAFPLLERRPVEAPA